eukprot:1463619-Amphidinium_carterae.1
MPAPTRADGHQDPPSALACPYAFFHNLPEIELSAFLSCTFFKMHYDIVDDHSSSDCNGDVV